jgi:hypothetical protein
MNEQEKEEFDVEGHKAAPLTDDEDVEGHRIRGGNNLTDDDEDVEGHRHRDTLIGDDEDVEGHRFAKADVQPPRDTDLGGTDR